MKKRLLLSAVLFSVIAVGCGSLSDASSKEESAAVTKETTAAVSENTEMTVNSEVKTEPDTEEITEISETSVEETEPDTSETESVTEEAEESEESDDTSEADSEVSAEPSVQTLDELIEKNFDCMINIFSLGSLSTENNDEEINWDDENSYIRKVTDSRFPDYASFSDYIYSIYDDSEAYMLLNNYPFEGDPKYINKDGELYLDLKKDGSKGYYVNWQNRNISIKDNDGEICHFTVETTMTMPAENPVDEPYFIDCTAICRNGSWVLADMYS